MNRNGYLNVRLRKGALSDRSGPGRLFLSDETSGDHRIADATESRKTVDIELVSIDDALADTSRVDFVKLDVQGAEALVLRGMRRVLTDNPQLTLVVEFAPFVMPTKLEPRDVLDDLFSRFEEIYDLDEITMAITSASPEQLLAAYTRENQHFTNLLCLKPRALCPTTVRQDR